MGEILGILKNFSLIDFLDIIIVAYIAYRVMLVFKQTRAVPLIKGIVALAVITAISEIAQLTTLSWLLNNVWTVGLLAIVILFQPELRRALEQFGRTGLLPTSFRTRPDTNISEAIEEVAKSTVILSKNKIGALIVWERETGMRDYMETGIAIDSLVSSSLLINMFIPKTPLHDGAVMIRKGRIVSAACYLPLTSNNELSTELGTRHRAAIGITENTDALAIIVSEETGGISLAVDGQLKRYIDSKTLADLLQQYLMQEPHERRLDKLWRASSNGK
ncbi:TIGR00159 family protein [Clostridium sp. 'deep sea']|uniref:diadenylate cyclase CdaA n=1 Tax=Clostridium sp. 'deep sea' TaxID=2779445 RepID=UPI00189668E0|nr:diadenylate cyclase CdaA [Clostridium sp. 'deep sea']QOR34633.1 TIGR00159 family protein [Clostridium sp. 'deep sea']